MIITSLHQNDLEKYYRLHNKEMPTVFIRPYNMLHIEYSKNLAKAIIDKFGKDNEKDIIVFDTGILDYIPYDNIEVIIGPERKISMYELYRKNNLNIDTLYCGETIWNVVLNKNL